jgi:catechol 2,3-dioxygenase-like lactoylglutathione lyase family enzyme
MARLQLALNVSDLDAAIEFYGKLFKTQPHKVRPGYANFAIADPPLKLVLFEAEAPPPDGVSLNHLGIEVFSTDEVQAETERLAVEGLPTRTNNAEVCCHALQDKVYTSGPDGEEWEIYTVLDDDPAVAAKSNACCA